MRVSAGMSDGRLVFQLAQISDSSKILGIDIFEVAGGRRSRTVCRLRPVSRWSGDLRALRSWEYGVPAEPNYQTDDCRPLEHGRDYGIAVAHMGLCGSGTTFRLTRDGKVEDLGPHWSGCNM
jgi:hypothetical protein